jgi:hypothetical protein
LIEKLFFQMKILPWIRNFLLAFNIFI